MSAPPPRRAVKLLTTAITFAILLGCALVVAALWRFDLAAVIAGIALWGSAAAAADSAWHDRYVHKL